MVDSNYYKSLWIILNSDKKNTKVILDFINSIPLSVYKSILKSLEEYKDNKKGLDFEKVINNMVYYFRIASDGSMCLGKFSNRDIENNDIFMMKLYPYSDNLDINKEVSLGSLIYQKRDEENTHIWDCDKAQYNLVKNRLGLFLIKICDYAILFEKKIKKINIELLSDVIDSKSLYMFDNIINKKEKKRKRNLYNRGRQDEYKRI